MSGEGEDGKRERPICLGADNLSCYSKAEVETNQHGFISFKLYLCCQLFLIKKCIYIVKGKLYFKITSDICAEVSEGNLGSKQSLIAV